MRKGPSFTAVLLFLAAPSFSLDRSQPQNRAQATGFQEPGFYTPVSQMALATGRDAQAERFATYALNSDPNNVDALSIRGAARMRLGNMEGARADAMLPGQLDPSNRLSRTILSYLDAGGVANKAPNGAALAAMMKGPDAGAMPAKKAGAALGGENVGMIGGERSGAANYAKRSPSAKDSDVFAFAVLAYETLVGKLPFPGPNYLAQKKNKLFDRPQQADPSLPAALDPVFEKSLDPEPAGRPRSAGEFAGLVAAALGNA